MSPYNCRKISTLQFKCSPFYAKSPYLLIKKSANSAIGAHLTEHTVLPLYLSCFYAKSPQKSECRIFSKALFLPLFIEKHCSRRW